MKKLILIVGILLLASIAFLRLYDRYSPEVIQQRQNVENIYKVKVGMSEDTVVSIMAGRGLVIPPIRNFPFHQYTYATNYDSFSHLRVIFDSTMRVQEIYIPTELDGYNDVD